MFPAKRRFGSGDRICACEGAALRNRTSRRPRETIGPMAPQTGTPALARRPRPGDPLRWLVPGAAVFVASLLFTPNGATIFLPGDVRIYLLNAARMEQGQVIYRDFFQFTSPGTELVYLALFKVFGQRAWIPNVTLLVLGLSLFWLSVVISRTLISGWAVFLPGTLLLTVSLYHGLDPSHQWFSVLAVMAAAASLTENRAPPRMALAGVLCGLASFFTLPRGLLAALGFAIFLVWERRRNPEGSGLLGSELSLAASYLVTVFGTNAYFVWKAGLSRFIESTIIFGVRYYQADAQGNTLRTYLAAPPSLHPWYGLPWVAEYLVIHVLLPGVYLLFALRYWREGRRRPELPWDRLMLIGIAGMALFVSVAPAPSYFRLCVVSLPALILFAWLLTRPGRPERVVTWLTWALALLMAVADVQQVQRHASPSIDLASGRTAFLQPALYEQFQWLSAHTRPSESFFEAGWANTYVALGLRNPTPVPYVTVTAYTRPDQVQDSVEGLEAHQVQLVLWPLDLDTRRTASDADSLGPLRAELRSRYRVIETFSGGDQVWQRE